MRKLILCETKDEIYKVAQKLSIYGFTWLAFGELGEGYVPVKDWAPIWTSQNYDYMVDTVEMRAYYCLRSASNQLIDAGMEALLATDYLEGYIE